MTYFCSVNLGFLDFFRKSKFYNIDYRKNERANERTKEAVAAKVIGISFRRKISPVEKG